MAERDQRDQRDQRDRWSMAEARYPLAPRTEILIGGSAWPQVMVSAMMSRDARASGDFGRGLDGGSRWLSAYVSTQRGCREHPEGARLP